MIKTNYKEQYTKWLTETNIDGSNKSASYIRAIDVLSETTQTEIFEEDNLSILNDLYEDLLKEQRNPDGKYNNKNAPSYGEKGFYSAAIKSYSEFIQQLPQQTQTIINTKIDVPLNIILYGPPGTGKTYNSIDKAVEITTGLLSANRSDNKKQFDELRKQGQIEFVTFHQNYSYEDFMIGIRPNIDEETNGLTFNKHYGIFYKIAERARENYYSSIVQSGKLLSIQELLNNLLDKLQQEKIKLQLSRSAALPPLSPFRTVRATFTAYGSSDY